MSEMKTMVNGVDLGVLKAHVLDGYSPTSATVVELIDRVLRYEAAISTRKPYGYGIVDKDGQQEPTSVTYVDKESLENIAHLWNKRGAPSAPFRVVELFYEDSES